jgi:hypothetical protein
MSRDYDIVYPAKGRLKFDGGKNSKFERSIIADNESPDCMNVVFSNGAVETRGGSTQLNTTAIGTFAVDGLYTRRDNTGAETLVVFAGGSGWYLSGASTFTTIASAQSVFTAGVRVGAAQMENHLFIGNGGVTPYKYNGNAFTRHGVPQATGTVSAVSIGSSTGVINGEVRYKVAYVNSASVLGDVGTATVTATITNGKVHLTDIPVAPTSHGVSARRIYRNFVSGATGTYGLLTTLNDNTTTTYVDNTLDASLGATAPTDQGEPPKYSCIVQHAGRLFMNDPANPNYVWYTELWEPYTVKVTNFHPVGDASFDIVKGLAVYQNGIVVQCETSLFLIHMPTTDPTDWQTIRIPSGYGSKSPFGAFLYNSKLMVPAVQSSKFVGFAAISGASLDPDASMLENARAGSLLKSERIEPDMFDVQEAHLGNISAIVYRNKAYVSVTSGTGQTTNNKVFVFDFSISNLAKNQEASWAPLSGVNATQFTVYDGELYYGSSSANGLVYQLDTTSYNDNGSAVDSYYWTKEFSGLPGHENLQKDFRKVKLLVEMAGPYYMTLTYRVDSDAGQGTTKLVALDPGSMVWGSGRWGVDVWGGGSDQKEITVSLGQTTGKRIQFKFTNQNAANQRFKVHGMNFTYNIKGRR